MTALNALEGDWYDGTVPDNVELAEGSVVDTSYGLTRFASTAKPGLAMRPGSGSYGSTFIVGPNGQVTVGAYTCLNTVTIICEQSITIGSHCLIAWSVVISDVDYAPAMVDVTHSLALERAASGRTRHLPPISEPRPVSIGDAAWIGFGSVILPGITVGSGSVVGSKSVVTTDVPPFTIVAGNPARVIRQITPVPDLDALIAERQRDFGYSQSNSRPDRAS